jgi:glycosyltransferase involved in cell wall biosynthesis
VDNLCLIICTKDRPFDLRRLLKSVQIQKTMPQQILVVDGSDHPIESVLEEFTTLKFKYFYVRPPSLPKQRNVGIANLPSDCQWVGFLDDDLVLRENSIEMITQTIADFKGTKKLGGLGMIIDNNPNVHYSPIKRLFLTDHPISGKMLISGCPSYLRKTDLAHEVEWLSGGTTFWHIDVLKNYKYDEWFEGTGYFEDVDFSYRVSRDHALLLCGPAKCEHYHHPVPINKYLPLGVWQITSWWYFVSKMKLFKKYCVLWAMCSVTINNLILGILRPKSFRFLKFLGNLKGASLIFTGHALERRIFHK